MEVEEKHVKEVYTAIADHFSNTRFCIWDFVKNFLETKTPHMRGIDIGCGNGKNMTINRDLDILGVDICDELLNICREKNLPVINCDCCDIKLGENTFDYAMSVAVFHHMSNDMRRYKCLKEMIRILKPGGKGLFSVWSIENQESRRDFDPGDNFVPWTRRKDGKRFMRFYYIFNRPMITELLDIFKKKIIINKIFNERGNWVVKFTKYC